MIHFDGPELQHRLELPALISRIATMMADRPAVAQRMRMADAEGRELLSMPAMLRDYAGIKCVTVMPANRRSGRPTIAGLYTLFDLVSGHALATMAADELTARRTSAVSGAASSRLARMDASTLTVLGAGHLAPFMAAAHAMVRPIRLIRLWARRKDQADVAAEAAIRLLPADARPIIEVTDDLEAAVRSAGIVSAATSATSPIIRGEWLRSGTHVDLVGSYRPDMREIDDFGITRASVFVDHRESALCESGDLIDPIARGILSAHDIRGDLADLCDGTAGRSSDDEVTVFKAVGIGIADLIAAIEVWEQGQQ